MSELSTVQQRKGRLQAPISAGTDLPKKKAAKSSSSSSYTERPDSSLYYATGYLPYLLIILFYYWVVPYFSVSSSSLSGLWMFGPLVIVFGVIPIIDYLVDVDEYNPTREEAKVLDKAMSFRYVVMGWMPAQLALIFWSCAVVAMRTTTTSMSADSAAGNATTTAAHSSSSPFAATYFGLPVGGAGAPMGWLEWAGLVGSVGLVGGMGINCAHEMIHKIPAVEQWCGRIVLASVGYSHFYTEHLFGHHKRVSTPEDPASSRLGEAVYPFLVRSVFGSFASAWHIECERLNTNTNNNKNGHTANNNKNNTKKAAASSSSSSLLIYSPFHNRIIQGVLSTLAIAAAIYTICGPSYLGGNGLSAVIFFFIQAVIAFCLLEIINYVEHYGLERKVIRVPKANMMEVMEEEELESKKDSSIVSGGGYTNAVGSAKGTNNNGSSSSSSSFVEEYEQVTPAHSWNAGYRCTNYLLFKLQRHSDHHAYAGRRYQVLRTWDASPQLPFGYATMIVIALCPPLWFKVMDWRVHAVRRQVEEWEAEGKNPFAQPPM